MIRILSGYFTAGCSLENGKVARVAPIIKYMIGWSREKVLGYCQRKGWRVEEL